MNRYLWIILLLAGCRGEAKLKPNNAIEQFRLAFAPDHRTDWFDIQMEKQGDTYVLTGETTLPEAKDSLVRYLRSQGSVVDQVRLLPDSTVLPYHRGVVSVSVANIRSKPGHSQELATQALLGTPLEVLKKEDNWNLVRTPDRYLGYLEDGAFASMQQPDLDRWDQSAKVIYTAEMGLVYQQPEPSALPVSDVVAGCVFQAGLSRDGFLEVGFPDGRSGYIPEGSYLDYQTWLATRDPSVPNIIRTAHLFMGRPYLWGGTSGKGVDCSGFTKMVFYLNGLVLPRDASQQALVGTKIKTGADLENCQPGDLLFFGYPPDGKRGERITHVAIYLGNGKFINSAEGRVQIQSLHEGDADFAAQRLETWRQARRMLDHPGEGDIPWVKDVY
ncbi:MAG: C40 family peptidase [Lewinellaceae bacterium]|nr:C40 family peptidase [Lewinellaceae bacterium]